MADDSTFDKVAGKAKEFAGKVTGDKDTEAEGKVKEFAEDVKSDVKAVGEKIKGAFKKD